ncbi:glycoside hydrolase family 10 protein [Phanerochaete carnosa HHB-10118-sp]|uniref:Beta-xylanase n=1 Tax=Phanerochaete carnosa (strain HHB-10118-sp) TaxID=650164 RepID=K5VC42_PHACS|nr:glycoside hydrolase family 10 protein [Phanerochaete carnosa HHB-10118-sp]EKM60491.1 glycoside hydrolase family 10 protein [Phanerochaete carnosa HHB-10118-sp]
MKVSTLSTGVVLLPLVLAAPATQPIILRNLAVPRFFGAAANTSWLYHDKNYTEVISTQFSIFTPENEMKWENIEPEPDSFDFGPADEIVQFAESVGAKMRGHNFMWGNQLPTWVNSSLTATELDKALQNHITTVMDHYRGKIYAWDVINEMISDNTPNETFKDNIWTQKFGEEAMPKALTYARAVDQQPKLYINDYGIEELGSKSDTLYSVVQGFLRDGVPVDAIGFQCHFTLGQVPGTLQQNLQRFADLGLDVAVTELDINLDGPGNATAFAQQAKDYWTVVNACMQTQRCVSVSVWGVSDDHSWIPNGEPLPWDAEKQPKPAFYAIADAFEGMPER